MKLLNYLFIGLLLASFSEAKSISIPKEFIKDFEPQLCINNHGNAKLKGLKLGDRLKELNSKHNDLDYASSFLQASPKKAPRLQSYLPDTCDGNECEPAEVYFSTDYVNWSCQYSAESALRPVSSLDATPKGSWVEGVKGDGIGEVLIVPINGPMIIWSGFSKNKKLF